MKKEKIKLQLCSNCKIADFCGKTCQEQAWKEGHKKWCLSINNPKKNHYLYQDKKYRVPKGRSGKPAFVIMDSRNCYLMSVHFKSYRGVELILSQYMNQLLSGPPHLVKRFAIPMMHLNLGKDNAAYNFIKFWLMKSSKCGGPYESWETTNETYDCNWGAYISFAEDQLPFDYKSLKGQDKKENLITVLDIDVSEPPSFLDSLFYIHLCIIKCNAMDGLSEDQRKEQESHLKAYLTYIEDHFPGLPRNLISTSEDQADALRTPHVASRKESSENYSKNDLMMPENFGMRLQDEKTAEFLKNILSLEKFKIENYLSRAWSVRDQINQILRKCEKRVDYGNFSKS